MQSEASDAAAIHASQTAPEAFALVFDRHFDAVRSFLRRRVPAALADRFCFSELPCNVNVIKEIVGLDRDGRRVARLDEHAMGNGPGPRRGCPPPDSN